MKYYSQHGEDFLLWRLFERKQFPGVFVEVGGLDGIRFSNTYSFEQEGWKGVCVEPHPDYFRLLAANRPGSQCVEAAASHKAGTIEFYAEPRGEFSTSVTENVQDETLARKMKGYQKISVTALTLDKILQDAGTQPPIDVVSIDVEGAELDVLAGFTLSLYQPRVLVIEANDEAANRNIDKLMRWHGYHKAGRLGRTNNFYCRKQLDALKLALTPIHCHVIVYPLPNAEKNEQILEIREPSLMRQAWQKNIKRVKRRLGI